MPQVQVTHLISLPSSSRVAQWKRAGPITQRSEDRNLALLDYFIYPKWQLLGLLARKIPPTALSALNGTMKINMLCWRGNSFAFAVIPLVFPKLWWWILLFRYPKSLDKVSYRIHMHHNGSHFAFNLSYRRGFIKGKEREKIHSKKKV